MIFEFGKTYIVDVTEKGITPLMIFDEDRWYDKDHDDLDFLTDEEKIVVINDVLDKLRAEIESIIGEHKLDDYDFCSGLIRARNIIDKYRAESEGSE